MINIYEEAIDSVANGSRFSVNLKEKNLKIDGEAVIDGGQYSGNLGVSPASQEMVLAEIEELYQIYKNSVPSERSSGKSKTYFVALPESKLSDDAMMYGESREVAQISLELYLLCQILNGFRWEESMGKWFWQSKKDKDLVILKEWLE